MDLPDLIFEAEHKNVLAVIVGSFTAVLPQRNVHGYGTQPAGRRIHVATRDHRSVGYRVPKEWAGVSREDREVRSIAAFKRRSRAGFLAGYGRFVCDVGGCGVCGWPGA